MKRRSTIPFSASQLDRSSDVALHKQLYDSLRMAIFERRYAPGSRIPSSRSIAEELELSRNTVMGAVDQLIAEGYLEGRVGAGTYVSSELPNELLEAKSPRIARAAHRRSVVISARGKAVLESPSTFGRDGGGHFPFRPSLPAYDQFPLETWARIAGKVWRRATPKIMGYGDAAGYLPLRAAVAAYLREYRGVRCETEQVIITSGSQQGLDLAALILIDEGDKVVVEDPGYLSARTALRASGAHLVFSEVDAEGATLPDPRLNARLYYVTPSFQYPLGITMSLKRRLELLEWAERKKAWLLEDDYDAEFRYTGRPVPAMQGLDRARRVIYVGTFSKVLLPGLRLGYVVVPDDLIDPFVAARMSAGRHSQLADQAVLVRFIEEGHFYRHIRRMRVLYAERQEVLLESVHNELSEHLSIAPSPAGMHVPAWLRKRLDSERIAARAAKEGITLVPISRFASHASVPQGFLLGYTSFSSRKLRDAVRALRPVFDRAR